MIKNVQSQSDNLILLVVDEPHLALHSSSVENLLAFPPHPPYTKNRHLPATGL